MFILAYLAYDAYASYVSKWIELQLKLKIE